MNPQEIGIIVMLLAFTAAMLGLTHAKGRAERAKSDAILARSEATSLRERLVASEASRDQWKKSSNDWRDVALRQDDQIREVNAAHAIALRELAAAPMFIPPMKEPETPQADGAIADPPSVAEADRTAAEARRKAYDATVKKAPLRHGRIPVSTQDPERQPVHRVRETESL